MENKKDNILSKAVKNEQKKEVVKGIAIGMGYICGKHNIKMSNKEVRTAVNKLYKEINQ
jgi:hypothetical protein